MKTLRSVSEYIINTKETYEKNIEDNIDDSYFINDYNLCGYIDKTTNSNSYKNENLSKDQKNKNLNYLLENVLSSYDNTFDFLGLFEEITKNNFNSRKEEGNNADNNLKKIQLKNLLFKKILNIVKNKEQNSYENKQLQIINFLEENSNYCENEEFIEELKNIKSSTKSSSFSRKRNENKEKNKNCINIKKEEVKNYNELKNKKSCYNMNNMCENNKYSSFNDCQDVNIDAIKEEEVFCSTKNYNKKHKCREKTLNNIFVEPPDIPHTINKGSKKEKALPVHFSRNNNKSVCNNLIFDRKKKIEEDQSLNKINNINKLFNSIFSFDKNKNHNYGYINYLDIYHNSNSNTSSNNISMSSEIIDSENNIINYSNINRTSHKIDNENNNNYNSYSNNNNYSSNNNSYNYCNNNYGNSNNNNYNNSSSNNNNNRNNNNNNNRNYNSSNSSNNNNYSNNNDNDSDNDNNNNINNNKLNNKNQNQINNNNSNIHKRSNNNNRNNSDAYEKDIDRNTNKLSTIYDTDCFLKSTSNEANEDKYLDIFVSENNISSQGFEISSIYCDNKFDSYNSRKINLENEAENDINIDKIVNLDFMNESPCNFNISEKTNNQLNSYIEKNNYFESMYEDKENTILCNTYNKRVSEQYENEQKDTLLKKEQSNNNDDKYNRQDEFKIDNILNNLKIEKNNEMNNLCNPIYNFNEDDNLLSSFNHIDSIFHDNSLNVNLFLNNFNRTNVKIKNEIDLLNREKYVGYFDEEIKNHLEQEKNNFEKRNNKSAYEIYSEKYIYNFPNAENDSLNFSKTTNNFNNNDSFYALKSYELNKNGTLSNINNDEENNISYYFECNEEKIIKEDNNISKDVKTNYHNNNILNKMEIKRISNKLPLNNNQGYFENQKGKNLSRNQSLHSEKNVEPWVTYKKYAYSKSNSNKNTNNFYKKKNEDKKHLIKSYSNTNMSTLTNKSKNFLNKKINNSNYFKDDTYIFHKNYESNDKKFKNNILLKNEDHNNNKNVKPDLNYINNSSMPLLKNTHSMNINYNNIKIGNDRKNMNDAMNSVILNKNSILINMNQLKNSTNESISCKLSNTVSNITNVNHINNIHKIVYSSIKDTNNDSNHNSNINNDSHNNINIINDYEDNMSNNNVINNDNNNINNSNINKDDNNNNNDNGINNNDYSHNNNININNRNDSNINNIDYKDNKNNSINNNDSNINNNDYKDNNNRNNDNKNNNNNNNNNDNNKNKNSVNINNHINSTSNNILKMNTKDIALLDGFNAQNKKGNNKKMKYLNPVMINNNSKYTKNYSFKDFQKTSNNSNTVKNEISFSNSRNTYNSGNNRKERKKKKMSNSNSCNDLQNYYNEKKNNMKNSALTKSISANNLNLYAILYDAILSLYDERIKPTEKEVVRKLKELNINSKFIKNIYFYISSYPEFIIEKEENSDSWVVYLKNEPEDFKGFFDPCDKDTPCDEKVWNSFLIYLIEIMKSQYCKEENNDQGNNQKGNNTNENICENNKNGLQNSPSNNSNNLGNDNISNNKEENSTPVLCFRKKNKKDNVDQIYRFKGGRYNMAVELKNRNLSFLKNLKLGEICHLIQKSISLNILRYEDKYLQPLCACNIVVFSSMFSLGLNVEQTYGVTTSSQLGFPHLGDIEIHPIRTIEQVKQCLNEILKNFPLGAAIGHLKKTIIEKYGLYICPMIFRYTRLCPLLASDLFSNTCRVFSDTNHRIFVQLVHFDMPQNVTLYTPKKAKKEESSKENAISYYENLFKKNISYIFNEVYYSKKYEEIF